MCWIGWSKGFQISRGPKSRNIDCIGTGDQHHYRSLELLQYLQSQLAGFSKHIHFCLFGSKLWSNDAEIVKIIVFFLC